MVCGGLPAAPLVMRLDDLDEELTRARPGDHFTLYDLTAIYVQPEEMIGFYADIFGCSNAQARDQLRDFAGLEAAAARPMPTNRPGQGLHCGLEWRKKGLPSFCLM